MERPRNRCPITLLIDDPCPGINPLYYFASQVPKDAVDYHYTKRDNEWYFDSDVEFKFPIAKIIEPEFVQEFAKWVGEAEVNGKISVVPFPAGLGRIDRRLKGFPIEIVKEFVTCFRGEIAQKFDIGPEVLTHTRALNLNSKKLMQKISEHDWSQKQGSITLAKYIGFSLEILKNAGLNPTGVTSPCNFGMYVEDEYVRAILEAAKNILGLKVVWYFLHVDSESYNVDHRVMYLDRKGGEAVISIIGSMSDPFWTGQITDLDYDHWVKERIDPVLSVDGKSGRIADQVRSKSFVTIVTHWQSLYSNGSRYGLKGLRELVSRINATPGLKDEIIWKKCSEIAEYLACASSVTLTSRKPSETWGNDAAEIEVASPFVCSDFTFSFETDLIPSKVILREDENKIRELRAITNQSILQPDSWLPINSADGKVVIFVCLAQLMKREEKTISYGVTRKIQRRVSEPEYVSSVLVVR